MDPDARAIGRELLEQTSRYDIPIVLADDDLNAIAVRGMLIRGRRLLRGVFALLDAGLDIEAMVLVRSLVEWTITLAWLVKQEPTEAMRRMGWYDATERLKIHRDVAKLTPDHFEVYGSEEVKALEDERDGYVEALGGNATFPNLATRALKAKLSMVYALPYRVHSAAAAHPTMWGLDQLMDPEPARAQMTVYPEIAPGRPRTNDAAIAVRLYGLMVFVAATADGETDLANRVWSICAPLGLAGSFDDDPMGDHERG